MSRKLVFTAALGSALSLGGLAFAQVPSANPGTTQSQPQPGGPAQAPSTNLGTPMTQPQPGGGVSTGVGAPTSAERLVPGSSRVENRGPPPAGGGGAAPGGGPGTSSQAPSGAITPGSSAPGGTGGSSGNN